MSKKSKKDGDEYDYLFCVFDLDTVRNVSFIDLINQHNNKRNSAKIYPILCFPCIEFWFILGYQQFSAPFSKEGEKSIGNTVENKLKEFEPNYNKTNIVIISELAENYRTAKFNAEQVAMLQMENDTINPFFQYPTVN